MISKTKKHLHNPAFQKTQEAQKNAAIEKQQAKRKKISEKLPKLLFILLGSACFWLLLQLGIFHMMGSYMNHIWNETTKTMGFRLEKVTLVNSSDMVRQKENQKEIFQALEFDMDALKNYNISMMAIESQDVKEKIEALSWVKQASVHRILPNILQISIQGKSPFVTVEKEGRIEVLDAEGSTLPMEHTDLVEPLLHLSGEGAFEASHELINILADTPYLSKNIRLAKRVSDRRWDIYLNNGILVKVPESNYARAWEEVAKLSQQEGLFSYEVNVIDLRVDGKVIINSPIGQNQLAQLELDRLN